MTIPPFPSQDLAKLVLGYLAEEQLMTAYDEFLQASPYLDAFQNEYDRIFMTSLKSILAEYRAVKIYVETCKPILLRKKIFQCTNLLDIVKLLVNNIDLNKLQSQEAAEKANIEKHHNNINPIKTSTCETCASLKLGSCVCIKLRTQPSNNQSSHVDGGPLQNSIETTPLADLPGNHVTTRKKQMKVLEKDSAIFCDGQNSASSDKESLSSNLCIEENRSSNSIQLKSETSTVSLNTTVKGIDSAESRKKIEEFDNVLKSVLDKNSTVTGSVNKPSQRVSNASTFQDFASGVSGQECQNPNVPDSSTSESLSIQAPLTKDYYKDNVIGSQKRQLLLQVSQRNENIEIQTCRRDKIPKYTKLKIKPDDQKVKILSDVKVASKKKTPKNATSTPLGSTPLVQMRTIVINGAPAYTHAPVVTQHMYTKDEIMAMPTLIVVPASGPKVSTGANCKPIMTQNCNPTSVRTTQPLGPLVIDVPPTPAIVKQPEVAKLPDLSIPDPPEAGLVKTVDFTKNGNASVPKDSVTSCATKTPQVLPPMRKSSSTPRRTTHVRVLDFATPRRILHETNEQVTSQTSEPPVEIVLSSSPNVSFVDTTVGESTLGNSNTAVVYSEAATQRADGCDTDTGSAKENNTTSDLNPPPKSNNWDAHLRALIANDSAVANSSVTKCRRNTKKKKATNKAGGKTEKKNSGIISPKIKKAKKRWNVIEEDEDDTPSGTTIKPDVPIKPTINIISGSDCVEPEVQPVVKQDNINNEIISKSSDKDDECIDTPEGDRLSLQNVIGARLNISDLLETPYKQALYDIQMGTPRFLSDLPGGEPLSDIKITNIPTPRFLDTPKPVQATPPSWSSRPTDYSSGGSYYKPDDQDYVTIPDLRCVVSSSSKEDITSDKSVEVVKDDERKSRPQRQCAKNVSYYKYGFTNKVKEADDTIDAASTCSDSAGSECKNKEPVVKTPRDRPRPNKSEAKKKVSVKRKKSPAVKEKQKSFIKIKPRQTPTKLTPSRNKKNTGNPGYNSPNKYRRIRTTSKNVTPPLVVAAPTKSRRKSSTPRKLHCTKSFNSEHSNNTSPETTVNTKLNIARNTQDSDTEQIALRWSDDGSQDTKIKETTHPTTSTSKATTSSVNDCEDISQIQEYIQTSGSNQPSQSEESFHCDLMKRGFDVETAKIIERDLLDIPQPTADTSKTPKSPAQIVEDKKDEKTRKIENDSNANDLVVDQDETEEDEIEFSAHECNEESQNYFTFQHDDTKEMSQEPPIRLKEMFSMNICIDDGVTVRLRATPLSLHLNQDPMSVEDIEYNYYHKETEMAVNSITNIERLYTPLKDSFKGQCYEIFDSTLTSLDTPLKANTPSTVDCGTTVTEMVLEDQTQKDNAELKRKRPSSDESTPDNKKTKYLLTSASIQNIDIESVLTKLHGP